MSRGLATNEHTNFSDAHSGRCTTPKCNKADPARGTGLLEDTTRTESPDIVPRPVNRLKRSKLVFRAYLDARALGDDDEAAELFALWLRLLEREREP